MNGLKFLNIEKIIFATAKIIFSMSSVCYDVITGKSPISGVSETDSHVDFVDFLRDLILISLDRIHYYQVLDKIHWQINHDDVCGDLFKLHD